MHTMQTEEGWSLTNGGYIYALPNLMQADNQLWQSSVLHISGNHSTHQFKTSSPNAPGIWVYFG